jgi:hypothetical protein
MQLPLKVFRGAFKPAGTPRIDWSDPITEGLSLAFTFDDSPLEMVVGASNGQGVGPTTRYGIGAPGMGLTNPSGGNSYVLFNKSAVPALGAVNALTAFCLATYVADGNDEGISTPSAAGSGNWFNLIVTSGNKFRFETFAGSYTDLASNATIANGGTYAFGARLTGSEKSIWINGAKDNSTAFSSTLTGLTTTPAIGAHNGPTVWYWRGVIYCWYYWNRALTDAEMLRLALDPFGFMIYPEDDIFATLVGSSVTPPSSVVYRRTLSSLGTRVGSRQAA